MRRIWSVTSPNLSNVFLGRPKLYAIITSAVTATSARHTRPPTIARTVVNLTGKHEFFKMYTKTLAVDVSKLGEISHTNETFRISPPSPETPDFRRMQLAARALRESDVPVAFPTETVYGLGADAMRSSAVRGIYKAKQRPSDNPLIVHVASLTQVRELLLPGWSNLTEEEKRRTDPLPPIYMPLIQRFWPGPLTVLLPLPSPSPFAPEVTAGLNTVGVRMPNSTLALTLIHLASKPIAAPSANASGKPSPTTAAHVVDDLAGKIEWVVDGGEVGCEVGVESTVVDGLSDPPAILRPGGISLEEIRSMPGWDKCIKGYRDRVEEHESHHLDGERPRAPGMKYRHYSPKARVILYEAGSGMPSWPAIAPFGTSAFGVIRTLTWPKGLKLAQNAHAIETVGTNDVPKAVAGSQNLTLCKTKTSANGDGQSLVPQGVLEQEHPADGFSSSPTISPFDRVVREADPQAHESKPVLRADFVQIAAAEPDGAVHELCMWDIGLGPDLSGIARGLFSALRELDRRNVDVIFVEGVDEGKGQEAAAIMNRLRKAASG